jgi:hypothetical protein
MLFCVHFLECGDSSALSNEAAVLTPTTGNRPQPPLSFIL